MRPEDVRMVYCDEHGELFDHPELAMAVFDGMGFRLPYEDELVPCRLAAMSTACRATVRSGRFPARWTWKSSGFGAVAAFASPAWLRLNHRRRSGSGRTHCHFRVCTLGWYWSLLYDRAARRSVESPGSTPVRPGYRPGRRRACRQSSIEQVDRASAALRHGLWMPRGAEFLPGREEGPLPTSPSCNARCAGCLSRIPPEMSAPATTGSVSCRVPGRSPRRL